jgi:hypothetical protein
MDGGSREAFGGRIGSELWLVRWLVVGIKEVYSVRKVRLVEYFFRVDLLEAPSGEHYAFSLKL